MKEVISRFEQALSFDGDGIILQVAAGPHVLPSVGIVAQLTLFDSDTLAGPSAELVLLPESEASSAEGTLERLASRVQALTVDDVDGHLPDLLGLPELTGVLDTKGPERYPHSVARVRERYALRKDRGSAWALPNDLLALIALLDMPSTWEKGALANLSFRPTEWLSKVLKEEDSALVKALWNSHREYPLYPAEFVHLFDLRMDGCSYGYLFDTPSDPVGFAVFHRGETALKPGAPCAFIAEAAVRLQVEDPGLGALKQLERLDLAAAACAFDEAFSSPVKPTPDRPPIHGGFPPLVRPTDGDPRWTPDEVRARADAYRRDDRPRIDSWIALAEQELAAGKPAFALVLGRELQSRGLDHWHAKTIGLLTDAYRTSGRNVFAQILSEPE